MRQRIVEFIILVNDSKEESPVTDPAQKQKIAPPTSSCVRSEGWLSYFAFLPIEVCIKTAT